MKILMALIILKIHTGLVLPEMELTFLGWMEQLGGIQILVQGNQLMMVHMERLLYGLNQVVGQILQETGMMKLIIRIMG